MSVKVYIQRRSGGALTGGNPFEIEIPNGAQVDFTSEWILVRKANDDLLAIFSRENVHGAVVES